jgi:hypothetical protein
MEINKVVARFKNGTIKKGTTSDFFPNKILFRLKLINEEVLDIKVEELKAIYFVKDFQGNINHKVTYNDVVVGGGRKVQVMFMDGEMLVGYTQGYSPNRSGFFVVPADLQNNNDRIYVITSATEKVSFL